MNKNIKNVVIDNIKTLFYALIIAILLRSLLYQPFYSLCGCLNRFLIDLILLGPPFDISTLSRASTTTATVTALTVLVIIAIFPLILTGLILSLIILKLLRNTIYLPLILRRKAFLTVPL